MIARTTGVIGNNNKEEEEEEEEKGYLGFLGHVKVTQSRLVEKEGK